MVLNYTKCHFLLFTYYVKTGAKIKKTKYPVTVLGAQGVHRNKKFRPEMTGNGRCNKNVKYKLDRRKSCNSSNESLGQGEKKS